MPDDSKAQPPIPPKSRVTVCPACGSTQLQQIRGKLHCSRCHAIVETCCDGLPG